MNCCYKCGCALTTGGCPNPECGGGFVLKNTQTWPLDCKPGQHQFLFASANSNDKPPDHQGCSCGRITYSDWKKWYMED